MMGTSDDPAHKLHAAMISVHPAPDVHFHPDYIAACNEWYSGLTDYERKIAGDAVVALNAGNQERALELAALLPAAPTVG